MTALLERLSTPGWTTLVLALLHTLWQGALIAGLLYVVLRLLPGRRANARYVMSLVALTAMLVCALVTCRVLVESPAPETVAPSPAARPADVVTIDVEEDFVEQEDGQPEVIDTVVEPPRAQTTWVGWVAALWLAGAVGMLVRAVVAYCGAGGLGRAACPLDNRKIDMLVNGLRRALKVTRRVGLAVCERVQTPAVLGFLRPVVLLPPAMLTGMSPEQLEAILAHELAHVRRYDYLVNLLQMLVEAMGFFNPAVWWISRQVRIEREACCDAAAAAVTGRADAVAVALADWAERVHRDRPQAVVAFADRDGGLLERIRRLVNPGHRPILRLPWYSLAGVLVLSAALLAGLSRGTAVAVDVAKKLLTPEERLEHLEAVQRTHGEPYVLDSPENQVRITGTVRTHDGGELPRNAYVYINSRSPSSGYCASISVGRDGRFSTAVRSGEIHLQGRAPGYAPAFAGPYHPEPGGEIADLELMLHDGFTTRVKLVGAGGEAIARAQVRASYSFIPRTWLGYSPTEPTDDEGVAAFHHCASVPMKLTVRVDGYQFDEWTVAPEAQKVFTHTLRPARPTTGVVTSAVTGTPIVDAAVKLVERRGFSNRVHDPMGSGVPVLARTDARGRFRLNTLRDDSVYMLFVKGAAHGPKFVEDVRAGQDGLVVMLGPEIIVRGRIVGPLDKLDRRRPRISYFNPFLVAGSSHSSQRYAPITIRDGVGHFEIRDLRPGTLRITAGGKRLKLDLTKSRDDVVIDLTEPKPGPTAPTRPVVLKFITPEGAPPPKGTVRVGCAPSSGGNHVYEKLEIKNGEARIDLPAPGRMYYRPEGTLGYWFADKSDVRIESGDGVQTIKVPCVPAGAIYGRLLAHDGTPGADVLVGLVKIKRPPAVKSPFLNIRVTRRSNAEFMVSPVPLGGTCRVVAHRDNAYVVSEGISLDDARPIRRVTLRLAVGLTMPVRLLKPDDTPAVGIPVQFSYEPVPGHSFGTQSVLTDGDGRVAFAHVNPNAPGTYHLVLNLRRDYVPLRMAIAADGKPVTVRLEAGKVVTGRVIDEATGRPVPKAKVYASSANARQRYVWLEPEGPTDDKGAFRFSNMPAGEFNLGVRVASPVGGYHRVTAGQADPVEIRIRIRKGSRLKPAAP